MEQFKGFLKEFFKGITNDEVLQVGAQLAYYLILSFFPFVIFLLNIASFTPLGSESVLNELSSILPVDTANLIVPILSDIIKSRSSTLLSISLVLALWSGSAGINALTQSMTKAFHVENTYKPITKRIISIFYTLLLAILILLVVAGPIFGSSIIRFIRSHITGFEPLFKLIRHLIGIIPFALMIVTFTGLYKWGPGFSKEERLSFKHAFIGAVVATFLFVIISFGFSFYVNNFGNYANTYGIFGGIIILLIWLYLGSTTIMIGAEVSAALVRLKRAKNPIIKKALEPCAPCESNQKGLGGAIFISIASITLLKMVSKIKK